MVDALAFGAYVALDRAAPLLPQHLGCYPFTAAPVPRCDEQARPYTNFFSRRDSFLWDVVGGIFAVCHRPAFRDHPGVEVFAERLAHRDNAAVPVPIFRLRSEEHTSELQSLMRISYAVFCLKNKQ